MRRKKTEIIKVDVKRNHRDRRRLVLTPTPRFNLRIAGMLAVLVIALSSTVVFILTREKGEIVPSPPPSRRILQVLGSNPNDPAWTIDVIGDENFRILSDSTVRMLITGAGNVGIGDTTPASLLTVGSGDLFQVNSSGAIAAATGITSSGTINFSGLTVSKVVFTDASKNLSSTGTVGVDQGGTGQTSANAAFNALAPSQSGNSGKFLTTDGTDTSWATVSGEGTGDISYYRHYGTTGYEAWYTSPTAGTVLAGSALTGNRLYAMPFVCPKAITIDNIGIYVSTAVASNGRLGIYSDNGNCYPGTLLFGSDNVSTASTGAKKVTISPALNLSANSLYWLALVDNGAPSIYCIPVASSLMGNILGYPSGLTTAPNHGLYVSYTFAALPATFPGSPAMITAAPIPAIFVRVKSSP